MSADEPSDTILHPRYLSKKQFYDT